MTKEERYKLIMDQLLKRGSVLVSELSEMLDVSSVTIRKDLTEMEKSGKLYRSHGKAIIVNPFTNNRTVNEKEKLAPEEKYAIGMEAAKLITYNDSIIIASGTTIHSFAQCVKPIQKLTVVSASLKASMYLSQDSNIDIIQLGGMLRHSSLSVVGSYGETFLLGCSRIWHLHHRPSRGASQPDYDGCCAEDNRLGRLVKVWTPRLCQDCQPERRGYDHHRFQRQQTDHGQDGGVGH